MRSRDRGRERDYLENPCSKEKNATPVFEGEERATPGGGQIRVRELEEGGDRRRSCRQARSGLELKVEMPGLGISQTIDNGDG